MEYKKIIGTKLKKSTFALDQSKKTSIFMRNCNFIGILIILIAMIGPIKERGDDLYPFKET